MSPKLADRKPVMCLSEAQIRTVNDSQVKITKQALKNPTYGDLFILAKQECYQLTLNGSYISLHSFFSTLFVSALLLYFNWVQIGHNILLKALP